MNPGPTFGRVYEDLKRRLTEGEFGPGEHLEPAALGEELHSSITPVRDALHRLSGERLVWTPRNDGFRVPMLTEAELRDLYAWKRELVDLALRRAPVNGGTGAAPTAPTTDMSQAPADPASFFLGIARLSCSGEMEAAIAQLNHRLGAARRAEETLLDDLSGEMASLVRALALGQRQDLRRMLGAYHRRRQRCVPALLVAMRRRHLHP